MLRSGSIAINYTCGARNVGLIVSIWYVGHLISDLASAVTYGLYVSSTGMQLILSNRIIQEKLPGHGSESAGLRRILHMDLYQYTSVA